jgi:transcriptional regulator with XRE-family HTH domain
MTTEDRILKAIHDAIREAGSQNKFAELCGVSGQYISEIMRGHRRVGPRVLRQLGYERYELYRKYKGEVKND